MITIHRVKQGTPEWHELREGDYTGSNADKLLQGNRSVIEKGRVTAYAKAGGKEWGGNFSTKRGHILEDEAIELYEQIKGVSVQRPGYVKNSKYPGAGYSPDGLLPDRTIEVKAFNMKRHYDNHKYVELKVMAQAQFGELICEKDLCDLLLYNPDVPAESALLIVTIKRQPTVSQNFRRHLKAGENLSLL